MPVRRTLVATAVLALGLALAGCSASSSDSAGTASGPVQGAAPPAAGPVAEDGALGSEGGDRTGDASGSVALDRSIVVVASTTVRVDDVTLSTDRLGTLVAGSGGRIESQQVSRGGTGPVDGICVEGTDCAPVLGYAASTTTVRLPTTEVDAFLRSSGGLGTVESGSRSSTDVTAEVADVDARLRSAEASLARVRALLGRAETIADVVALESELARRQADLEALQARQRVLDDQTAQATVTVVLVERDAPVAAPASTGFLAGLSAGWDAFTSAAVVGLTVLGAVLPFAALALIVGLVVWFVVRRTRRAAPAPTA